MPHHAELFASDYAYFSSFSASWLRHSEAYVQQMAQRFDLGPASHVVEVAANDGYLLQYVKARGIPCLGIDPRRVPHRPPAKRALPSGRVLRIALADELVAQA